MANDVIIPIKPGSSVTVDWGDGSPVQTYTGNGSEGYPSNYDNLFYEYSSSELSISQFVVGDMPYHEYATHGQYDIKLTGRISGMWPTPIINTIESALIDVKQWGDIQIDEFAQESGDWYEPGYDGGLVGGLFSGRPYFKMSATDSPNLAPNADLSRTFAWCAFFMGDIRHWDVSNVTAMDQMFRGTRIFDQDLSNWVVDNVVSHTDFAKESPYSIMKDRWPQFKYVPPIAVDSPPLTLLVEPIPFVKRDEGGGGRPMSVMDGPDGGTSGHYVDINIDMFRGGGGGPMLANYGQEETYDFSPEGDFNNEKIIVVDWGDGTMETFSSMDDYWGRWDDLGHVHHKYDNPGQYVVKIWGTIPGWKYHTYGDGAPGLSMHCVKDFSEFGDTVIESYRDMFSSRVGFTISATDKPTFTPEEDLSNLFDDCPDFNSDISHWDMSNVMFMNGMFQNAKAFNQPLNTWDVSNVIDMSSMFSRAEAFDQDISSWNVGNVTDMSYMFYNTKTYDQPMNNWNVSKVTDMGDMFSGAETFNQDLSSWDVSKVTDLRYMFSRAEAFNGDVSNWKPGAGVSMRSMFENATAYTQSLKGMMLSGNVDIRNLFKNTPIELDMDKYPIDPMVFTVDLTKRDNTSSSISVFYNSDVLVDWGDGTIDTSLSHDYGTQGTYTIKFLGSLAELRGSAYGDGADLLVDVSDWGTTPVDLKYFFRDRRGFTISATNAPRIVGTSLESAFEGCIDFNEDISHWDVSNVTSMRKMFKRATIFNQDLSGWDVSNVRDMFEMFEQAETFNQPLNTWNVSNVTDMDGMFKNTKAFNQPLDAWDVSSVTNMGSMFSRTEVFDQDISSWDISNVTDMGYMFHLAKAFNTPLGNWDLSHVTRAYGFLDGAEVFNQPMDNITFDGSSTSSLAQFGGFYSETAVFNSAPITIVDATNLRINGMFEGAVAFNQPLDHWNLSNNTRLQEVFKDTKVFDQDLSGWDVSKVTSFSGLFSGAEAFNQDLSSWNVSGGTYFGDMFKNTKAFNQPLDAWDVSSGRNFGYMFNGAEVFNQPLNNWDVSAATSMDYMFLKATLFDQDLSMWNVKKVTSWRDFARNSPIDGTNKIPGFFTTRLPMDYEPLILKMSTYVDEDAKNMTVINIDMDEGNNLKPNYRNTIVVDWGDGRFQEINSSDRLSQPEIEKGIRHEYKKPGTYDVRIWGSIPWWYEMENHVEAPNLLVDVVQWGETEILHYASMFAHRPTFTISAVDAPNINPAAYPSFARIFKNCPMFNQDISHWDTTHVVDMTEAFQGASMFNQDLSGWNVGNVKDMIRMFENANVFDQDLSGWDVTTIFEENMIDFAVGSAMADKPEQWPQLKDWGDPLVMVVTAYVGYVNGNNESLRYSWNSGGVIPLPIDFNGNDPGNEPTPEGVSRTIVVDWGDGKKEIIDGSNQTKRYEIYHRYNGISDYTIKIWGTIPGWWNIADDGAARSLFKEYQTFGTVDILNYKHIFSGRDRLTTMPTMTTAPVTDLTGFFERCKALDVSSVGNWDVSSVTNMRRMFAEGASTSADISNWNTANVTDMSEMFLGCTSFNGDISTWDVSKVTDMAGMFSGCHAFNADISGWDVSNVINFERTFYDAQVFDQPIGAWNVTSNVTNMREMFRQASKFNQPIGNWDVSGVTSFEGLFASASVFNQDLSSWNTSNVTTMNHTFASANAFNGDISSWNTSNVTDMTNMLAYARAFNQPIGNWDVSNVTNMTWMFAMNKVFDHPLNSWDVSKVSNMVYMFYGAFKFNQPLSSWNTVSVVDMNNMFQTARSYDQDLSMWDTSSIAAHGLRNFAEYSAMANKPEQWPTIA